MPQPGVILHSLSRSFFFKGAGAHFFHSLLGSYSIQIHDLSSRIRHLIRLVMISEGFILDSTGLDAGIWFQLEVRQLSG